MGHERPFSPDSILVRFALETRRIEGSNFGMRIKAAQIPFDRFVGTDFRAQLLTDGQLTCSSSGSERQRPKI
jgi:hypothetical protein